MFSKKKDELSSTVDKCLEHLPEIQHSVIIKLLNKELFSDEPIFSNQKLIEVSCQLLVSDFRYRGYTKDDLREYFEETIKKENVWKKSENIIDFRVFLSKIDPFEKRKFKFWFKISNITLEDGFDFHFTYNKVNFVTLNNLKKLNLFSGDNAFFRNISSGNIFAEIEISNFSKENSIRKAKYEIKNELTYINQTLNSSAYLVEDEYIYYDGIRKLVNFENESKKVINEDDLNSLNNTNLFLQLKDIQCSIFKFETQYLSAVYYRNLNGLWEYLEHLYKYTRIKSGVEEYFANNIVSNHSKYIRHRFKFDLMLFTSSNYIDCKILGISFEEQIRFHKEWHDIELAEYEKFEIPIIKKIISLSNECDSSDFLLKEETYFRKLAKELKEYRNQYTHTGQVEANLEIKLETLMYDFFEKFRSIIFGRSL